MGFKRRKFVLLDGWVCEWMADGCKSRFKDCLIKNRNFNSSEQIGFYYIFTNTAVHWVSTKLLSTYQLKMVLFWFLRQQNYLEQNRFSNKIIFATKSSQKQNHFYNKTIFVTKSFLLQNPFKYKIIFYNKIIFVTKSFL